MSNTRRLLHLSRKSHCSGKVKWPTQRRAHQEAQAANLSEPESMMAYRCSFCGQWHVGRPPRLAGASA